MLEDKSKYKPGVCNIGAAEIERRRRTGLFGTLTALGLVIIMGAFNISDLYKLIVFVPAFMGAIGLLQAYTKFCAAYGLASVFNLDDKDFKTKPVLEQQAIEEDKRMAWNIIAKSLAAAIMFTLIAILIT